MPTGTRVGDKPVVDQVSSEVPLTSPGLALPPIIAGVHSGRNPGAVGRIICRVSCCSE